VLVTSPGCTPCLRVKRILNELQQEMPGLSVDEVDFASQVGLKLAGEHKILYPPAVIVNGTLIGQGKIDADEMVAVIRQTEGAYS